MIRAVMYAIKETTIKPEKNFKALDVLTSNNPVQSQINYPLQSLENFTGLIAISLTAYITARFVLHLISFPQFTYMICYMFIVISFNSLYAVFELTIDRSQHVSPW